VQCSETMAAEPKPIPGIERSLRPDGVLSIVLNRPRVNALSNTVLKGLAETFRFAQSNSMVKAIVITSAIDNVFCAGLDLKDMVGSSLSDKEIKAVIDGVEGLVMEACKCLKPMACAVEGHALAGGFVLATACDFVALKNSPSILIGLTEVRVGVPFPRAALEISRNTVGQNRSLRRFVLEAKGIPAPEAYAIGFGDVLVDNPRTSVEMWLKDVLKYPLEVYSHAKRQILYPFFEAMQEPSKVFTGKRPIKQQDEENIEVMRTSVQALAKRLKAAGARGMRSRL